MSQMLNINKEKIKYGGLCFLFSAVKKDVKVENDDRMQQFKKKAKELRILDAKTAQNLCKYIPELIYIL